MTLASPVLIHGGVKRDEQEWASTPEDGRRRQTVKDRHEDVEDRYPKVGVRSRVQRLLPADP